MLRLLLHLIPSLTVVVVGISWLVLGQPKPVLGARVYLGPNPAAARGQDGPSQADAPGDSPEAAPVALRFRVVSHHGGVELPVQGVFDVRVYGDALREPLERQVQTTDDGVGQFNAPAHYVSAPGADLRVRVSEGERILAEGEWRYDRKPTRGYGETVVDEHRSGISARLSFLDGPLAVPFESQLLLSLFQRGRPLAGAPISLQAQGAELLTPIQASTDEAGQVRVAVGARQHLASLALELELSEEPKPLRWEFSLPVVPGAIRAQLEDGALRIRAPTVRTAAYVNLIDEHQTLMAARVPLVPEGLGSEGQLGGLDQILAARPAVWAVTSSEYDLQSMALVGWPIGQPKGRPSLDRRDQMAIDGIVSGLENEAARQATVREATLWFAAAMLLLELFLFIFNVYRKDGLAPRVDAEDVESSAPSGLAEPALDSQIAQLWVPMLVLVLGFILLASLVAVR